MSATMTTEMTTNATGSTGGKSVYFDVKFEVPFLIVVCVLGFLGNTLVVLVYTKKKFQRSNAATYILNLAATDFTAVVVSIFHVTEFYMSTWPILWSHNIQCQIHRYFRFVAFNSTVFTMMAIAIDRYYAVTNPVIWKARFTMVRTRLIILTVWMSAFLAAIPVAFMFQSIYSGEGEAVTFHGKLPWACKAIIPFGPWWKDFKPFYLNIFLFYIPVIITSTIYLLIFYNVWKSNRFANESLQNGNVRGIRRNSHWRTGKTLLCVFIVFIVCFAPFATYNIVQQYFTAALHPELKNLALLLPYFNSCLNPVVYSFTNPTFWRDVRKLCGIGRCSCIRAKTTVSANDYEMSSAIYQGDVIDTRSLGGAGVYSSSNIGSVMTICDSPDMRRAIRTTDNVRLDYRISPTLRMTIIANDSNGKEQRCSSPKSLRNMKKSEYIRRDPRNSPKSPKHSRTPEIVGRDARANSPTYRRHITTTPESQRREQMPIKIILSKENNTANNTENDTPAVSNNAVKTAEDAMNEMQC